MFRHRITASMGHSELVQLFGVSGGGVIFSTIETSLEGVVSRARAIEKTVSKVGPLTPRSSILMNVRSRSHSSANASWEYPAFCLSSRRTIPKARRSGDAATIAQGRAGVTYRLRTIVRMSVESFRPAFVLMNQEH
jgi:hypothetical protein